jgi:transposase-like protein
MDKKQAVQIVHDRKVKQLSYRSLGKKYGVPLSTLHRMINTKQEEALPDDESLPDDVKALKEALRKERLKNELLNLVIDISSKELGVDLRKKHGTRQSE